MKRFYSFLFSLLFILFSIKGVAQSCTGCGVNVAAPGTVSANTAGTVYCLNAAGAYTVNITANNVTIQTCVAGITVSTGGSDITNSGVTFNTYGSTTTVTTGKVAGTGITFNTYGSTTTITTADVSGTNATFNTYGTSTI